MVGHVILGEPMERLDNLISKVLNHSVMEEGEQLINPEETDLMGTVNETLQSMKV